MNRSSTGRRSAGAPPLFLRLKIDPDMGKAFDVLSAVSPRKRSREATYFLRRGIEEASRTPPFTAFPRAKSETVTDPNGAARDNLAGLPGIDD